MPRTLLALLLGSGVAGCAAFVETETQSTTRTSGTIDPAVSMDAQNACIQAVSEETGGEFAYVIAADSGTPNALVALRDSSEDGTWRCLVANGSARVEELEFAADA